MATLFALVAVSRAHAATVEGCHPRDTDLVCHLRSFLTLLDATAWVLAVVLLLAVLLAIRACRSRSRKLTHKEISLDE